LVGGGGGGFWVFFFVDSLGFLVLVLVLVVLVFVEVWCVGVWVAGFLCFCGGFSVGVFFFWGFAGVVLFCCWVFCVLFLGLLVVLVGGGFFCCFFFGFFFFFVFLGCFLVFVFFGGGFGFVWGFWFFFLFLLWWFFFCFVFFFFVFLLVFFSPTTPLVFPTVSVFSLYSLSPFFHLICGGGYPTRLSCTLCVMSSDGFGTGFNFSSLRLCSDPNMDIWPLH